MYNFTALDFETANQNSASACAIGLIKIVKNEVADSFYSLIKPPENLYFESFIRIHGIRPADTMDAPRFVDLWPELVKFIGRDFLVAHNASFDKRVFDACVSYYQIAPMAHKWKCSVIAARKAWPKPQVSSHGLSTMAEFLNLQLDHHNALSDATACAHVYIEAQKILAAQAAEKRRKKNGFIAN